MASDLRIQVLGPTAVFSNGVEVNLGGRRQRRLLTALVADAGIVLSGDRLVDRVWADEKMPADPVATLRTYLTRLRQALGADDVLLTEPSGWRLDDRRVDVDAARFVGLVDAAAEPGVDVHRRLSLAGRSVGLVEGRSLRGGGRREWIRADIESLNELRVTTIERRFEAMLAAGMHTDALPGLVAEVEAHPLRERLVGLEMLALFRAGRQAEATRVFQAHRDRLDRELGLEPGADLVGLDARIVAGDPSLLLTSTPGRALRGYRLGRAAG